MCQEKKLPHEKSWATASQDVHVLQSPFEAGSPDSAPHFTVTAGDSRWQQVIAIIVGEKADVIYDWAHELSSRAFRDIRSETVSS